MLRPIGKHINGWVENCLKKTGIWLKDVYGEIPDAPTDADGDYIDENGQKFPVLPFWCW